MTRLLPLCLALLLCLPALAQQSAQVSKGEKDLERVRARIQALQRRIESDRSRRDEVRLSLEESEKKISEIRGRLRTLEGQAEEQQEKVRKSQEDRAQAQAALDVQRKALARQLRAAYLIGENGQLKMLLSQQGAQKVGRVLTYYDYLNKSRAERIQNLFAQLDFVREVEQRLRTDLDALTALKSQQQQELAALQAGRNERQRVIRRLAERMAGVAEEVDALNKNEAEIQKLLEGLRDVLADIPANLGSDKPFFQQRGHLPWPVRGPLLADFGQSKAGGKFTWNGRWIGADEGTPIRAAARGRVAYVGWMQRYGLIVILEHEHGYYTLYGHLLRVPRAEGEWINPGEMLGLAGDTGGYDRPGVYFEVRKGREPLDPKDWLEK